MQPEMSNMADQPQATKKRRLESNEGMEEEHHAKILEELDNCQVEIDQVNEQASEEILKIEQKYSKVRNPLYGKRKNILEKIDDFWFTAFVNHPVLRSLITTDDEECLLYLKNFEVEENEEIKNGFKFKFYFNPNPFFENEILVKEYDLTVEGANTTSIPVKWLPGQSPSDRNQKQNGTKGRKRDREEQLSFFGWYEEDDVSNEEIADHLKDDLWQNPVQYYIMSDSIAVESGEGEEDEDGDHIEEGVEIVEEEEDGDEKGEGDGDEVEEYLEEEEGFGNGELDE